MGLSKIDWTDAVWNPVTGCTKVSAGCAHCYAERMSKRLAGRAGYPAKHPFAVTLHPDRLDEPLRWRKPRRVFVCSMGDLFHEDVPDGFIHQVFATMELARGNTYQVLTKRPERMAEFVAHRWSHPEPHIWFGTSVENQATADECIPHLLRCPAAVRFVSYEPALGTVDFDNGCNSWLTCDGRNREANEGECCESYATSGECFHGIDWIIAGGESGPRARPAHPDWFRSVRDQCAAAGVAFWFKQWGEWSPTSAQWGPRESLVCECGVADLKPNTFGEHRAVCYLNATFMKRVGKHAAGRLLDGVEHREWPKGGENA